MPLGRLKLRREDGNILFFKKQVESVCVCACLCVCACVCAGLGLVMCFCEDDNKL
jgi:hypothetical protein